MCLSFACTHSLAQNATVSKETVGHVIYCLDHKLSSTGDAPPKHNGEYSVRFDYRRPASAVGHRDALRLLFDEANGQKAFFYGVYLLKKNGKRSISIEVMGTLKRETSQWKPDETTGGAEDYDFIKKHANKLEAAKPVMIPDSMINPGNYSCEENFPP